MIIIRITIDKLLTFQLAPDHIAETSITYNITTYRTKFLRIIVSGAHCDRRVVRDTSALLEDDQTTSKFYDLYPQNKLNHLFFLTSYQKYFYLDCFNVIMFEPCFK